jgi:hypothetical protein
MTHWAERPDADAFYISTREPYNHDGAGKPTGEYEVVRCVDF